MSKTKQTMRKKITITLLILIFVVGLALLFWGFKIKDNNDQPQQAVDTNEWVEEEKEQEQNFEEVPTPPKEDDKQKQSSPRANATVSDPPLVYTGYGHAPEDPLKLTQETSTTCTTSEAIDCYITFVNESGKKVSFDTIKTDSQGIAVWDWLGGKVGAGTWTVQAHAGDKTSDKEIIYIQ